MEFELAVWIEKAPREVYEFLQDLYKLPFHEHPTVPVYEKLTPGSVRVGTQFREVVRVPLFFYFEVTSEITCLQPEALLEYRWKGPGLHGTLSYEFKEEEGGTRLVQHQTLILEGPLKIFNLLVRSMFSRRINTRLIGIKAILEGWAHFAQPSLES